MKSSGKTGGAPTEAALMKGSPKKRSLTEETPPGPPSSERLQARPLPARRLPAKHLASGWLLFVALALLALACGAQPLARTSDGAPPANASSPTAAADAGGAATGAGAASESSAAGGASAESSSAPAAESGAAPEAAAPGEWPQWRGPARDGRAGGFQAPQSWPKSLREQWKVSVGTGHASPVVSGGRVYVFARQGEEEVLRALDAATGKEIWKSGNAVGYEVNRAAAGHGKGPKSTPVVARGRVYTLGITGVLSAHDAKTGRVLWRKSFSGQYPATSPLYGTSMSPVVEGDLLIAHVGGHERGALTAFDAATGKVRWSFEPDGPAYSSPVVATLAGVRQVITFTQKELVSVAADFGTLLWKLPAKTAYDTNCNTPVVYKDTVIFTREGRGLEAVRPVRQGRQMSAQEVWRNEENELYMNTPVIVGSRLFGMSSRKKGQFFMLDADTGKTLWQSEGRMGENASVVNTGQHLLILTDEAALSILPADAASYAPAAQYTVATSPTWAHPVPLPGRVLVKDETTLASLAFN